MSNVNWQSFYEKRPSGDFEKFYDFLARDVAAGMGMPAPKKETPELQKIVGGFCSHIAAAGWRLKFWNNSYVWDGPTQQVSGTFEYSGPLSARSRQTDLAMVCLCLADAIGMTAFAAGLRAELKVVQTSFATA